MPRAQSRAVRICRGAALFGGSALADKQKRQRVLPFYGGRRGIRLTAIADRECQGHNRVQPGYAAVRHYSGVLPSPINKKGNGCCLFMAEGEGFALQRLPIGNAKGTIACSPGDERSAPGISKTSPSKIKKNPCRFFLWRKARDSNPRILSHQRFSRPPLSTAQPAFRACKLYHKKRLICKPYRKIKEENQKLPYGTKVVCPYAYSAGRATPCNLIPQA